MANDELDALDALEKEAKEYDKVGSESQHIPNLKQLTHEIGC